MSRTRDNQRTRLYRAEEHGLRNANGDLGMRFLACGERVKSTGNVSIAACQSYVDYVTESDWYRSRAVTTVNRITVRHKSNGSASTRGRDIMLPPWARHEAVILHEIAHVVTDVLHHGTPVASHGPEFAGVLLGLVREFMGEGHAAALVDGFRAHRVQWGEEPGPRHAPLPVKRRTTVPALPPNAEAVAAKAAEVAASRAEVNRVKRRGGYLIKGRTAPMRSQSIAIVATSLHARGERVPEVFAARGGRMVRVLLTVTPEGVEVTGSNGQWKRARALVEGRTEDGHVVFIKRGEALTR